MQMPSKEDLPLEVEPEKFSVTQATTCLFHKAFRDKKDYFPPTLAATALKGMFNLLNRMQVDWKKLLHATQSFEYHSKIPLPCEILARTQLTDIKLRAGIYWMSFEIRLFGLSDNELYVTSRSLILVRTQ
jgi:hypothetical protein